LSKFIVFKSVDDMPDIAVSKSGMDWNKTGSWRSSTPHHEDKTPPCNFNCPAGEDIRGYLDLLKHGKTKDAFELILKANPLPLVCGRVCYHPCQAQCNRRDFDTAIDIRLMEKFMGEWGLENYAPPPLPDPQLKRAAIIGAGPAGLTAAYYLRQKGIEVTVFDENEYPGGLLYYGIPSYRLPNDILKLELDRILHGIEFRSRTRFGRDFDIGELDNYNAVFLGTGAHKSKALGIEGENLPGVESGLDFLKKVNYGEKVSLHGKDVMVVGGGNTACDVARTAYRLGAKVCVMYRRTQAEMPAFAEEIEQLRSEPIKLEFLAAPTRIAKMSDGRLQGSFTRMKLGEPDQSGRFRPVPIPGSEFEVSADILFAAIGEDPDLPFFGETLKSTGDFNFNSIDKRLRDKLFVGGDILPNPRTVAHAVGSGRLAAEKIMAFFNGESFKEPESIAVIAGPEDINYRYFMKVNLEKRRQRLFDNNGIIGEARAIEEANRCMSCGVCYSCNNCYNFCPDMAVIKSSNGYQINLDYCKGCGICSNECPCGSIRMNEAG
jgi:NADPH-dependent glutamate synthase beta subunit-like oxidoreductase